MKISPVQGLPTIPNPSHTGLSPDKMARIKAIAEGSTPQNEDVTEEKKEEVNLGAIALTDTPTSQTQRIKMNVNRTVNRNGDLPVSQENAAPLESEPKVEAQAAPVAISDTNVQVKPKPEAIGTVSPELAQLAKEKRALQLEREQLAKEKEALKGRNAEELIAKLKATPLSVLQEHGVTYEQLTNEILGQPQQPQIDLSKIEEAILKKVDERLVGKDTAQEEAVYDFMRREVDKLSFSSNDYKLIRESKSQDEVMDYIKRMWKERGEIVDEKEAMDAIEYELREDAKRYAKLIGELDQPKPSAETPQKTPEMAQQKTAVKTLTNKDSARPLLSRRQRAIAAMLGQK